jgi:hypothetical protein
MDSVSEEDQNSEENRYDELSPREERSEVIDFGEVKAGNKIADYTLQKLVG